MNRIIQHLPLPSCVHCAAETKLEAIRAEVARIEAVMGEDVVQFVIPDIDGIVGAMTDEPDEKRDRKRWSMPRLHLEISFRSALLNENLAAYALREIKRMRRALRRTERKLESGVSE